MKNKRLVALLCVALMLMLFPQTAHAAGVCTYLDENGETQTATGATPVTADTVTLDTGWYVVDSDVSCNTTLTVNGDVKLILTDGFTLTVAGSSDNAGINVPPSNSLTIYGQAAGTGTVVAQGGVSGAGIGGAKAQNCGSVTIHGGTVAATGGTGGAGIGGGAGNNGGNGSDGFYGGDGGTGGTGGAGGTVSISGGKITANGSSGGAGIGGGFGGTGGRGGSWTSGYDGGRGGTGGAGGTVIIGGGMVKVSGSSHVKINGGLGGTGGQGGFRQSSGGTGGRGGTGGIGGTVIINGGTVLSTGSGVGIGIGGGTGGTGGVGGAGNSGVSSGYGPRGTTGTASGISTAVINGGSVNAEIGCIPTTGGEPPVNVYPTVVCLSDAVDKSVSVLSVLQNGSLVSHGVNDMKTDANGRLYLFLPAYDGDTTAAITAGGRSYDGYHGQLSNTATFTSPNVLKMDQSAMNFINAEVRTFVFEDEIVLDTEVSGGTLSGTVQYTYSGTDLSTGGTITESTTLPTNAGNYMIKATLPGNDLYHDVNATKGFAIQPKSIAGFMLEAISQQTYTGENITPTASVKDGTKALLSGTDYTITYENNKNTGTATVTVAGKGNYTGNLAGTYEILPKNITLSLLAAPDEAKVGSNVVLTASVLGAVDLPAGTVTFQCEDVVIAQDVPVNAGSSGYSAVATWSNVPVGEYNLTANYVAEGSDNYTCVSNGLISGFSITKYDQPDFSFVDGTDYSLSQGTIGKTYGDSSFTLQTTGALSTVPVSFAVTSGSDVVSVDSVTGLVSILKSGTAVVTATSPSDAMYNEVNIAVTIVVTKADQNGFGFEEPEIHKKYGDGAFIISASGGQSSGSITYTVTDGTNIAMVNATTGEVTVLRSGTAVITATKGTDDYYREAASRITIHVAKADQNGFGFAEPTIYKTYGDAPFVVALSGALSSGAVTYAGDDVAMVNNLSGEITLLRSGIATITAISPADDRYNEAIAQMTIQVAKAERSGFGFAESIVYKTYGDAPFVVAPSGAWGSGAVTYAVVNGSNVATVDETGGKITLLRPGIATITAINPADGRYNEAIAQMTVYVAKANQSGFGFQEPSVGKTYGDAPFVISASGGQSNGSVTYSVTSGENVVSVDDKTGKVTIHNSGAAVILAAKEGDDFYNRTTSTFSITVNKAATYVITPPAAEDISVIGALSSSLLSGGVGSEPGNFSWTNSGQIVSSTGMYEVTFTPVDSMNYTASTCEVEVRVLQAISHSSTGTLFDLSQVTLPTGVTSVTISLSVEPTADVDNAIFASINNMVNADPNKRGNVLTIYDLKLLDQDGNQIVNFSGAITVKIPIPDGVSGDLHVVWYNPEAGTMTDMNAKPDGDWLVFETTHFSYYAIVQMTGSAASEAASTPDAGGKAILIIALVLLGLLLILGFAAVIRMKSKRT